MDVYSWLIVGFFGAIAVFFLIGLLRAIFIPLPEWTGLTGEEYLKWKRGEKGKSDMSD